jgi:UDP-N-acetylmuramoylalanine--D-glutamate ligase
MRQNAAAAIAACLSMQIEPDSIAAGLKTFTPLPHRCENLGTVAGRHWINDSKATTPAAAMAAIRSCDAKPWVLLGGSGKDVDLRQFCDSIAQQVRGAALIGEKNGELYALLRRFNSNLPLRMCRSMIEAVHWLAQASSAGDVVLLSPACASLDQFRDYADRGNQFRDAVLGLKDSSSNAAMAAVDHAA